MSGWAPLFQSLTTGTLCGRWPDIGLWPIVLSLKDKNGIVDVTPDYLSRVTGLELDAVVACMARFCEPDPYSRTGTEDGRRLVLIDPDKRNWGWRVVNSGLYRERARVQAKDQERTESGADAERKRKVRAGDHAVVSASLSEKTERLSSTENVPQIPPTQEGVPRSPPKSPEVPLSDTEANTSLNSPRNRGCRVPEPFEITKEMRQWAADKAPHVRNLESVTEAFVDYWRGVSGKAGVKTDWVGTWRNRLRDLEEWSARPNGSKNSGKTEWM